MFSQTPKNYNQMQLQWEYAYLTDDAKYLSNDAR